MKQPIFIDTDMGVDDIVAIGLLLLSDKYTIQGVSVVNGVASISRGVKNARAILRAFNCRAPVYTGVAQKQQKSQVQFPAIDRKRANTMTLISERIPSPASETIPLKQTVNLLSKEKRPLTLFCLGPLSNINILLQNKKVFQNIRRLVIMGGAVFEQGNVAPSNIAEYNIRLDVSSAKKIFDLPITKLLIPVDATSYAPAFLTQNTKREFVKSLVTFLDWLKTYTPRTQIGAVLKDIILNNDNDFTSFYDPLATLVYINPTIVTQKKKGSIQVSDKKGSFGKTLFTSKGIRSTEVVLQVNTARFFEEFKKLLQKG